METEEDLVDYLDKEIINIIKQGNVNELRQISSYQLTSVGTGHRHVSYAHIAAKYGDVSLPCLKALVEEFGVPINEECEGHGICLHFACEGPNALKTIEYLLTSSSDINREVMSYTSITPLGLASQRDDLPTVMLLVQHSADVNFSDGTTQTILDYALQGYKSSTGKVLEYLLPRVSTVKIKTFMTIVSLNNSKILETAISITNSELIQSVYSGQTPLLMAVYHGLENSVKTLLSHGAWNPYQKRLGKKCL